MDSLEWPLIENISFDWSQVSLKNLYVKKYLNVMFFWNPEYKCSRISLMIKANHSLSMTNIMPLIYFYLMPLIPDG